MPTPVVGYMLPSPQCPRLQLSVVKLHDNIESERSFRATPRSPCTRVSDARAYHEVVIVAGESLVQAIDEILCTPATVIEAYLYERYLLVHPADQAAWLIAIAHSSTTRPVRASTLSATATARARIGQ